MRDNILALISGIGYHSCYRPGIVAVITGVLMLGGCYHATVNTGVEPGPRRVEREWATSFVYGLVPPDAVDAQLECGASGVARVETRLSFLNQLVGALTFGVFTPMEIVVTCGTTSSEDGAEPEDGGSLERVSPENNNTPDPSRPPGGRHG